MVKHIKKSKQNLNNVVGVRQLEQTELRQNYLHHEGLLTSVVGNF